MNSMLDNFNEICYFIYLKINFKCILILKMIYKINYTLLLSLYLVELNKNI